MPTSRQPDLVRLWGVPVHAVTGAFPLGALGCAVAFDLASHLAAEPFSFPRSAFWLAVVAVVSGLVVGVIGLVDSWRQPRGGEDRRLARTHVVLTDVGVVLALASLPLRRGDGDFGGPVPIGGAIATVAGFAFVFAGAALATRLRYPVPAETGAALSGQPGSVP